MTLFNGIVSATALCSAAVGSNPNVLMIIVDDLRPELGCYGGQALTPRMDALAASGLRYTNAHVQYPQCMPSRVSLLTGKRVSSHISTTTSNNFRKEGEPTLPEWFREHGYRTISLGKVYHHFHDNQEAWDVLEKGCDANPYRLEENRLQEKITARMPYSEFAKIWDKLPPHTEAADELGTDYQDGEIATIAIAQLKQETATKQPFFMAVGFRRPHLPWTAPQSAWDLYDPAALKLPDNAAFPVNGISRSHLADFMHYSDPVVWKTFPAHTGNLSMLFPDMADFPTLPENAWKHYIHAYLASVSHVDDQVGRLLDGLKSLGLDQNTFIVLFADHGFHLGEHKLWSKITNYDESSRIPLILAGPGIQAAVIGQPAELVDVYSTLCKLTGLGLPAHLHGDPLPLAPGEENPNAAAFMVNARNQQNAYCIITHRYRLNYYIHPNPNPEAPAGGDVELYDHQNDPGELQNVAYRPEYLAIQKELLARLIDTKGMNLKTGSEKKVSQ